MYLKNGKYYADWRDRKGKRLRKSFTSERAALRFEAEQKELAHPKQKARSLESPKYSAPHTSATVHPKATIKWPSYSSGLRVVANRANSPQRTQSKPSSTSNAKATKQTRSTQKAQR